VKGLAGDRQIGGPPQARDKGRWRVAPTTAAPAKARAPLCRPTRGLQAGGLGRAVARAGCGAPAGRAIGWSLRSSSPNE
jgi:hypothetical protein